MLMHWVRSALATGEEFAVAIRRKRIVLQENENWEVNVSYLLLIQLLFITFNPEFKGAFSNTYL